MYLQNLADLPTSRLNEAFERAVQTCKFFPTIAELRELERQVQVSPEAIEAAYQRRKEQILAAPAIPMLKSALDEDRPKPKRREIVELTEEQRANRIEELRAQVEVIKARNHQSDFEKLK